MQTRLPLNKRTVCAVCIGASLLSHLFSLILFPYFSSHPAMLRPPAAHSSEHFSSPFQERALEAFFEVHHDTPAVKIARPAPQPESLALDNPERCLNTPLHPNFLSAEPVFSPLLSLENALGLSNSALSTILLPLPDPELCLNFKIIPKDRNFSAAVPVGKEALRPVQEKDQPPLAFLSSEATIPAPSPPCFLFDSPREKSFSTPPSLTPMPRFPSLQSLQTISCSDFFDTELLFAPLSQEEGFVFALTLIPKPDLDLPKLRQHYTFMIDRSNSIQKERLAAVKNAVSCALETLDLEDSFNVIAFDSKVDKFASHPVLATKTSIHSAKEFIGSIQLGSFFSSPNLSRPLFLATPQEIEPTDLYTAILLSDGEALKKPAARWEVGSQWTAYNRGKLALFAIGFSEDALGASLEAISSLNGGKVLFSPANRGIKRKLLKLLRSIEYPIATHLSVHAFPMEPGVRMTLVPSSGAPLCAHEPYVLLGTVDRPEDFILFVQGKGKDSWINIKKPISFLAAKQGGAALRAQWARHEASILYAQYLTDFDSEHLTRAQEILAPHHLQAAWP